MNIQSVNVSAIHEIDHDGKRVRTGFFKRPVDGPVTVGRINLDGDDQADRKHHGGEHKAVYAFSVDEYAYWSDALGRDDLAPGAFGENLTVAGLDEGRLGVGDRLRAGSCLFEITQPRVPCFKLGIALGRDDAPGLFVERARPGVYLRVLETGTVEAGTELVPESSVSVSVPWSSSESALEPIFDVENPDLGNVHPGEPARPGEPTRPRDSIATLYRAAFDASLDAAHRLDVIDRALAAEALSGEWTTFLTKRRAALRRTDGR